ncbi:MAG: serine/threonine-protein kinase [Planctomycetota bacterium]
MNGDRRRQAEELFQRAADLPGPGRAEFIARQCGADPVLRGDVEQLLRAYEADGGGFMATPAGGVPTDPGEQQTGPVRRNVALKIVKLGMDTRQVVARFEAERQALALMEHPHIAKVYEAGSTESGRPYFAMEHVPGVPITEYCDRHRLTVKQRLRLFLQVCDAIQHAHQKGIIHRDVKPSNVLVKMVGDQAVPKVIDFGIAKATGYSLTELTLFTDRGQLIGTPEYMSPEQAEVSASNVDTRADIYSLGVVLYELLTGTLPFEAGALRSGTLQDIQSRIREQQPPRPSTCVKTLAAGSAEAARCRRTTPHALRRRLEGELDWITMKAMEKDRSRRYATVSELAGDVKRRLRHEPVLAGPPSTFYRLKKLVRRDRRSARGQAGARSCPEGRVDRVDRDAGHVAVERRRDLAAGCRGRLLGADRDIRRAGQRQAGDGQEVRELHHRGPPALAWASRGSRGRSPSATGMGRSPVPAGGLRERGHRAGQRASGRGKDRSREVRRGGAGRSGSVPGLPRAVRARCFADPRGPGPPGQAVRGLGQARRCRPVA